jgi:glycine/serine hydroxymethyltransferase
MDFESFRQITDSVNTILGDISHPAGLIAKGY